MFCSVVIPLHNEEENLELLHAELAGAFSSPISDAVEFLFVDDGSRDRSWEIIRRLKDRDSRVRGIRFRRNFGKAAALTAGFEQARGDVILTLDGDLQDDPAEIPRFLSRIREGDDVVSGWKRRRHDPWHKVLPSRIFNRAVSRITGCRLHDHNCGFKAYRNTVLREVRIYGELHRFVPVLAHARGFRISELEVHHRPRIFGHSKYGVARLIKGLLDLCTVSFLSRFQQRPLHILGTVGLALLSLGTLGMAYLAGLWMTGDGPIGTRPLLAYCAAMLGMGTQLFCLGVLAELITSYHIDGNRTFSVSERTTDEATPPRPVGPAHDDGGEPTLEWTATTTWEGVTVADAS